MQGIRLWSLGQEDPLEEVMATHSSTLAWRIPWTEEPGGLQSMGLQRVGHAWATNTQHTVPTRCQALRWALGYTRGSEPSRVAVCQLRESSFSYCPSPSLLSPPLLLQREYQGWRERLTSHWWEKEDKKLNWCRQNSPWGMEGKAEVVCKTVSHIHHVSDSPFLVHVAWSGAHRPTQAETASSENCSPEQPQEPWAVV